MNNLWRRRRYIFGSGVGGDFAGGGGTPVIPLSFSNSFWTMAGAGQATSSFAITSSASGIPVGIPSASMSISFWMFMSGIAPNTVDSAQTGLFLGARNSGAGAGSRQNSFWFQPRPGNGLTLEWGITDNPDLIATCGRMPSPEVYRWHHFLLVFDGSGSANNDRCKVFLNGQASSSITSFVGTIPNTILTSSQVFHLGTQDNQSTNGSSLVINNIGIYNLALTSSHASAMFGGGSPVDLRTITGSEGLVHYWSNFPVSSSTAILTDLITNVPGVTPMDLEGRSNRPNYFTSSGIPVQGAQNGSAFNPWA